MNTLEKWVSKIKTPMSSIDLINDCGVYNDLFFWMDIPKKEVLFDTLSSNPEFELRLQRTQVSNYYKTDLQDLFAFGIDKNQFLFTFPNNGIIFSKDSGVAFEDNEIGYQYTSSMQLGLFGKYSSATSGLIYIAEEFILKEKIPTFVMTTNCQDPEFKQYSVFIND